MKYTIPTYHIAYQPVPSYIVGGYCATGTRLPIARYHLTIGQHKAALPDSPPEVYIHTVLSFSTGMKLLGGVWGGLVDCYILEDDCDEVIVAGGWAKR
jgi:hypothetical protein